MFTRVISIAGRFFRASPSYRREYLRKAKTAVLRQFRMRQNGSILRPAPEIIAEAIALGRKGKLRLAPDFVAISATESCNLECIMCPGHGGKHGQHLSVPQAAELFAGLTDDAVNFGEPKTLDMTSGEATLNRDLGPIYREFKQRFPSAKVSIMSNATVPVRGRIKEAFELTDFVGVSLDGATRETYERIRKGSVWGNVERNVRDIGTLKSEGINCTSIQIMMVVMDQNIHELPAMVRFAHSVGIPRVFAQQSEVRTTPFNTDNQNIELTLPESEIRRIIAEAQAEADRLGVYLTLTSLLQDRSDRIEGPETLAVGMPTCNYFWFFAPRMLQAADGAMKFTKVCCHMPHAKEGGDFTGHDDLQGRSIVDVFNSEHYWNIREQLLDGSLADKACRGCQYFRMTQWTPEQLESLDKAIARLRD